MTRITTLGALESALQSLGQQRSTRNRVAERVEHHRVHGSAKELAEWELKLAQVEETIKKYEATEIGWPYAGVVVQPD